MKNIPMDNIKIPATANFVQQGEGAPVILIHGIAASLHDWDELIPELTKNGYASYALDLLGHGDSPKPKSRAYQMEWLVRHFSNWMTSLQLREPAILIGHSLGGYIALEYARRFPDCTRGLILVNPYYSRSQLHLLLRRSYSRVNLRGFLVSKTPEWMLRAFLDFASVTGGRLNGALNPLPDHVRAQTVQDYLRTAPGVYHLPHTADDLDDYLPSIVFPALVVWGERDLTLSPSSFPRLVNAMPRALSKTLHAGHVPHQSNAGEFNLAVMEFLRGASAG